MTNLEKVKHKLLMLGTTIEYENHFGIVYKDKELYKAAVIKDDKVIQSKHGGLEYRANKKFIIIGSKDKSTELYTINSGNLLEDLGESVTSMHANIFHRYILDKEFNDYDVLISTNGKIIRLINKLGKILDVPGYEKLLRDNREVLITKDYILYGIYNVHIAADAFKGYQSGLLFKVTEKLDECLSVQDKDAYVKNMYVNR